MGHGPAPGPTRKKALCHTCPLGGASIKYRSLNRSGCNNTALLYLLGSTSAGRAGIGVYLATCVLATGDFLRPQGPSHQAITPFAGWSPGVWGTFNKGNADGAVGIFGKCPARVGYDPAPGPTIKRPCATLSRSLGRGTNTAISDEVRAVAVITLRFSSCWVALRSAVLAAARIWLSVFWQPKISSSLMGPSPQAITPLRVDLPASEAPLIRGVPTGPLAFLENAGRVLATALRPDPPKKALCLTCPLGGACNKYRSLRLCKSSGCNNTALLQLLGCTLAGRVYCGTDLAECVLAPGEFLRPQTAFPPMLLL